MRGWTVLSVAVAMGAAWTAAAQTIDFESESVGPVPGGVLTYNFGGYSVEFSGPGLQIRQFNSPFPNTKVLSTNGDAGPIDVKFIGTSVGYTQWENIINGTYTGEVDTPIGTAYDSLNNIVDSAQNSNTLFVLQGPGIVRCSYLEGNPGEGFVMDNFSWQVPSPGAMGLFGAAGLVAVRRRR
jgi:hypothetical protein